MKQINDLQPSGRFRIILSLILLFILSLTLGTKINAQFSVTGPSLICTSGQYTVQNYTNEQLVWSSSSNLTLTSTQGQNPATYSANGNGSGWVKATITCCGYSNDYYAPSIWIGPPVIQYVVDEGGYPPMELYDMSFYPAYYDDSEPEYSLDVDFPGEVWVCSMGWATVYLPEDPYDYTFYLTSTNACGSDYLEFDWYDVYR